MKPKNKELLIKDLYTRLPYGVKVNAQYKDGDGWKTEDRKILGLYEDGQVYLDCVYTTIDCIKPYLRQMSSMTDEERKKYNEYLFHGASIGLMSNTETAYELIDWLNAHHFDYRGLIEKGLALEAPVDMYNIN